ncbi:cytochrome P450 [Irpex rosettiformis]|uniref:Cytochrome P450 n=1 Tax=Irpex rosettiformis TaxID=378272 RepID=A0ACB8TXG9_9APHY|nr:cytochrome P450 [Irpex rosettiformis]
MLVSVAQASFGAVFVWVLWKVFKHYILPSPLDSIPGPPRQSFLLGNMAIFLGREGWEFYDKLRGFGSVARLDGILGSKCLFVYDPKALQHILLKDQQSFIDPSWFLAYNMASYGPGLLSVEGEQHRRQRKMLNPAFSVTQMRRIIHMLYQTAHTLRESIQGDLESKHGDVDVLNWLNRSALDSIGQGGLGYSFDALHCEESNEFANAIKMFVPASTDTAVFAPLVEHLNLGAAGFGSRILGYIPIRVVQQLRYAVSSLRSHSIKIYAEKKAVIMGKSGSMSGQPVTEDVSDAILSELIKANTEAEAEDRLEDDEIIAQMSTIIFAATDTTSAMMSRILHLLSERPEVQERLRAEIMDARRGQDIPYDQLIQLPYLDAVCKETLRMYPPVPISFKQAQRDVVVPLAFPIRDVNGKEQQQILIPKGTTVSIGNQAANRYKEVWGDDADEWNPDRWLSPLPASVIDAHIPGVYSHLMSFLGGTKSCIGFKFAEAEMKVILSVLLEKFRFSRSSKEIYWNLSLVTFPAVGKTNPKSQLPLVVEVLAES